MSKESDKKNLLLDDEGANGFTRWIPSIIVFCVVAGFFTLSWYAYHAGMESVKEEDLLVVEADKTPVKEKPADPGGMQFPNQDKTIFETFGGSKAAPQKVERLLPTPEEPLSKEAEGETSTWINEKLADDKKDAKGEQVLGKKKDEKAGRQVITAESDTETFVAARKETPDAALEKAVKGDDKAEKQAAAKAEKEKAAAEKAEKEAAAKAEKEAKEAEAKAAKEAAEAEKTAKAEKERKAAEAKEKAADEAPAAAGGSGRVQLGAYRSEEEAGQAWDKMHLKHKELSDKQPSIVRADLGEKGIYYRLRITGLADAKGLCAALSAKGQACIIPVGK